ncbi:MAG: fimbrillin family protein [Bacteroidales bacterium]|nr:fimbrillin family protein [Bacteroidaceae bacterium]MBP3661924.1 fimbrillin family protein [Bacteroidales bacterium]
MKKYLTMAAAALALVACDKNNDDLGIDNTKDTPITLSTNVAELLPTRAITDEGKLVDADLGLFVTSDKTDAKYKAANMKWTGDEDGNWTPTDGKVLYEGTNSTQKAYAYSPFTDDADDGTITVDLTTQTDYLYAASSTALTSSEISLNMSHRLSKVTVSVTGTGTEVTGESVASIAFADVPLTATWTLAADSWVNSTTNTGTISADADYSALLLPGTASMSVIVTMNSGRVFKATASATEGLASGAAYTVELKVGRDAVTMGDVRVADWENMDDPINGGTAEEYYNVDATDMTAENLKTAVAELLAASRTEITVTLSTDASAEMFTAIREALVEADIADGSVDLTLAGVTAIPDNSTSYPLFGRFEEPGSIQMSEAVAELRSISLPDAVTVGDYAFYYCKNLTSLYAPKVQIVHEGAFTMTGLVTVELPEATTLEYIAFYECRALTSIKLPKVTTVGQLALDVVDPDTEVTIYLTADSDITLDEKCFWWVDNELLDEEVNLVLHTNKQSQVSGNTWTTKTPDGEDVSFTFKSISFVN